MDQRAQVLVDGFVSREELLEMMRWVRSVN